jgi:hypothetical protein
VHVCVHIRFFINIFITIHAQLVMNLASFIINKNNSNHASLLGIHVHVCVHIRFFINMFITIHAQLVINKM